MTSQIINCRVDCLSASQRCTFTRISVSEIAEAVAIAAVVSSANNSHFAGHFEKPSTQSVLTRDYLALWQKRPQNLDFKCNDSVVSRYIMYCIMHLISWFSKNLKTLIISVCIKINVYFFKFLFYMFYIRLSSPFLHIQNIES